MSKGTDDTLLRTSEAVLLGHAMVQRIGESMGIRSFFMKGPAPAMQGLREPKTSADVDVFVAPVDLELMLQALRDRGWRERPSAPDNRAFSRHSVTVDHSSWPCSIDVHFRFPGMDKSPQKCFEAMWPHVETLELAGQQVAVPSKPLGIAILALNSLRSPWVPACRQELDFLSRIVRRQPHWVDEILEIARETGSQASMRPFLEEIAPETAALEWPELSKEWCNRLAAREPGSAGLMVIMQTPWKDKPKELWTSLFPPREVLLSKDLYADMSCLGQIAQHRARWGRFLRALPRIAGDLHHLD